MIVTRSFDQALLEKYRREGPTIIRQDQVEQAIREIKSQNHMHQLGVVLISLPHYNPKKNESDTCSRN